VWRAHKCISAAISNSKWRRAKMPITDISQRSQRCFLASVLTRALACEKFHHSLESLPRHL
jgi:hypothetical protein